MWTCLPVLVMQTKIVFDQIYGWEYTLLEPNDFWKRVPDVLKPIYHFFNVPISAGADDPNSPLRFLKEIATEKDFVAFKLDIDTPEVEIPLALKLAQDVELGKLVDEFFFELHFRSELLMPCGWDDAMPETFHNLTLDRPNALQLFSTLRSHGMRAHFWP